MKLARMALVIAIAVGYLLTAASVGLTAKKSSPMGVTSTSVPQKSGDATVRKPEGSGSQGVEKRSGGKYRLLLRSETSPSGPSGRLRLNLILQNESKNVIYVIETGTPRDLKFEVKNRSGKTVLPRDVRREGLLVHEGKQALVPVNAGQQVSYAFELGDLYSLAHGEYTLVVKKVILLDDRQMTLEVKSAPLRLVFK
jgi:hypothetical protein